MSADDWRINRMNMNLRKAQINYDNGEITYEQFDRLEKDVKKRIKEINS